MGKQLKLLAILLASIVIIHGQQLPSRGFQIRARDASSDERKDQSAAPATLQQQLRTRQLGHIVQSSTPAYDYGSSSSEEEDDAPIQTYQKPVQVASANSRQYQHHPQQQQQSQQSYHQQQQQQQNARKQQQQQSQQSQLSKKQRERLQEELEDEVEEEPDMLKLLLEKSSFSCNGKTTGYYSDDTVGCQVFHYCHENTKHSWICPEGATFHQVHLICMPPSEENICEQSAKYHFVNDYLYKPINMEEHKAKPNVSLRYHDRYFPEHFYHDDRNDYEDDDEPERPAQVIRQQPKPIARQSSKPATATTATNYRQQQNVFRSPDEVNISLQQRRPYFTQATTARYEEDDEYSYEK